MDAAEAAPIGPIARHSLEGELEADAVAMAPVPQHLLDTMDDLYDEYYSVRNECLKLNASNTLNPIWETKVKILQQTLENLNDIRAAAMKTARELRTEINKDLLIRLDGQAEALLQDLEKHLEKMPSVIAAIKKNIADNRAISRVSRPPTSLPRRSRSRSRSRPRRSRSRQTRTWYIQLLKNINRYMHVCTFL
jgi:hypothetical protein